MSKRSSPKQSIVFRLIKYSRLLEGVDDAFFHIGKKGVVPEPYQRIDGHPHHVGFNAQLQCSQVDPVKRLTFLAIAVDRLIGGKGTATCERE